jgi:outer membrane autotransporter protein
MLANDVAGVRTYSSLAQLSQATDIANIVTNLDWTLNATQAATVFNELSSGSIYGSLANLRQNVAFMGQLDQLTQRRETAAGAATLWLSPVGNFAKFGGTTSGASKIDATSYGAAIGLDVGISEGGAFGFGFGYAKHNFDAQSFRASVDAETYTLGAYATQAFGPLSVNAKFAYGFSTFSGQRDLTLLARKVTGHFRGSEWDGSLGLSYSLQAGGLNVEPFGELALRHWHTNGFTEEGGAGIGLNVEGAGKTVFNPTLGLRLAGEGTASDTFSLKPYASLAYTFQGDAGTARTVSYVGDPAATRFVLNGVNPKGFGTIGAGVTATISNKISVSLGGSYAFGSDNSVAAIRSAIGFKF